MKLFSLEKFLERCNMGSRTQNLFKFSFIMLLHKPILPSPTLLILTFVTCLVVPEPEESAQCVLCFACLLLMHDTI